MKEELVLETATPPTIISPTKEKLDYRCVADAYQSHEYELCNANNPLYKCIRCDSRDINQAIEIKWGFHDWLLCYECHSMFYEWVIDKNADNGCEWAKSHLKRKYGGVNE